MAMPGTSILRNLRILVHWLRLPMPSRRASSGPSIGLVLWDIGSGLKATRRQLQRLLKLVREDQVAEIVVTYPDRLTRFGQEYLQVLFDSFGVTLTILEPGEDKTGEQELTDDLLALIASFSGRLYGMRSHKQKELLKCAQAVINN